MPVEKSVDSLERGLLHLTLQSSESIRSAPLAFFLAFLGLSVPYPDDAFLAKMKLGKQPRLWSRFCHH